MMTSQDKGVTHLKHKVFFTFWPEPKYPSKQQDLSKHANSALHDAVHTLHWDILYFQNNICFYTTHNNVISLYTHKESMAFPVPIITKHINTLKNYIHISHTEFDPNYTINVDGNDRPNHTINVDGNDRPNHTINVDGNDRDPVTPLSNHRSCSAAEYRRLRVDRNRPLR